MEKGKNPQTVPHNQVNESINSVFDLLGRVDERVQMFTRHQRTMDEKLDNLTASITDLKVKVQILEAMNFSDLKDSISDIKDDFHAMEMKIQLLENNNNSQENRWKTIFGFIVQLVWVVVAAFVLYKLGISAPSTP